MNPVRRAFRSLATLTRTARAALLPALGLRAGARAQAVRAIAGTPAAIMPARRGRRGTILIIVLGTLALMSVIAVIYVVVGRADRRSVAAFVGATRREEMPALVRDYLAGILGRDALATYRDGAGTLKREAFDYPYSDPFIRSVLPGQPGVPGIVATNDPGERIMRRFNPEGTFDAPNPQDPGTGVLTGSVGTIFEPRVPADPWLASTQPTNILVGDDLTDGAYPQYELRDWAHISNIAPDGRYVNLFNLRNAFNAATGFDDSPPAGEPPQISSRLTLTNADGSSQRVGQPQITSDGATANPNVPAHWSTHQIGAFRPVNAPMLAPTPRSTGGSRVASPIPATQSPWSYPEYAPYQWADADGDGFFDSRWQELVDASNGITSAVPLFPRNDGYRWFIAARVQDLSACVNVNTASDFLAMPDDPGVNPVTMGTPNPIQGAYAGIGATPADVDLRRLLTGEDLYELSGYVGWRGVRPPTVTPTSNTINPNSAQYYGLGAGEMFAPLSDSSSAGRLMVDAGDAAYNLLRVYRQFGIVPAPRVRLDRADDYADFTGYLNQQLGVAQAFGAPASNMNLMRFTNQMAASRRSIEERGLSYGNILVRGSRGQVPDITGIVIDKLADASMVDLTKLPANFANDFGSYSLVITSATGSILPGTYRITGVMTALTPANEDTSYIQVDRPLALPGATAANAGRCAYYIINSSLASNTFGLDSEAELRTYRTANDPSLLSPLEIVLDGRAGDDTLFPGSTHPSRYSILRSNRSLDVELLDNDRSNERGASSLIAPGTLAQRSPDGLADLDAMTRAMVDIRQYLTTASAARPLFSTPIRATWTGPSGISPVGEYREVRFGEDPRSNSWWENPPLDRPLSSADTQSVLGENQARLPSVQRLFREYCDALLPYSYIAETWDRTARNSYWTLSYGHAGSELALRHAAHMAVNMAAATNPGIAGPSASAPRAFTVLANEAVESGLDMPDWSWWSDDSNPQRHAHRLDLNEVWVADGTDGRSLSATRFDASSVPDWTRVLPTVGAALQLVIVDGPQSGVYPITSFTADYIQTGSRPNSVAPGTRSWYVRLDPDDVRRKRLADDSNASSAPINAAYTVFPIQPQPFLAEVSGFSLYTDAPSGVLGGDDEGTGEITIRSTQSAGNGDLAYQALAFQVTNPFPQTINLGTDEYYVECFSPDAPDESRFYRLTAPVSLAQHESVVLYAQLRDDAATAMLWDDLNATSGMNLTAFRDSLMSVTSGTTRAPVALEEFNPDAGGDPVASTGGVFQDKVGNYVTEFRLWAVQRDPDRNETTNLNTNVQGNDMLVDRLRDPGDNGMPTFGELRINNGNPTIPNAYAANPPPPGSPWPMLYNDGVTILMWSTVRRPSDSDAQAASDKREVVWLPAYCIERKYPDASGGAPSLNIEDDDGFVRSNIDANFIDTNVPSPDVSVGLTFDDVLDALINAGEIANVSLKTRPVDKTLDPIPSNNAGRPWTELREELYTNLAGAGARGLRPSDLLIPPAIGPSVEGIANGSSFVPLTAESYTTLSEAMALALDYDVDPDYGTAMGSLLGSPARPQTMGNINRGSLDRGHLVLDDFVPFLDRIVNTQGYNPAQDVVYDEGQPLALRLLDRFRALGGEFGNERRATPGLININTAPLAVLRTLPMLSPPQGNNPGTLGSWTADTAWWGDMTGQTDGTDVASGVVAYRDRITQPLRLSVSGTIPTGQPSAYTAFPYEVSFSPELRGATARGTMSVVPGVRELPGFRSVSELMNVRDARARATSGGTTQFDFDRMGRDQTKMDANGLDPIYRSRSGNKRVDPLEDEFDERLTILSALENCVTVRSDVYCVWFVLHGYRESDCTGLTNDRNLAEPLIPSVARRFVMVVDRSNVVAPGDQPKILMFREVPYSATAAGDGSAI